MQVKNDSESLLNLPPPDRSVLLQSPPPETAEFLDELEGAPSRAGPIDFKPGVEGENFGRIVYRPNNFKAPIIIIEGTK